MLREELQEKPVVFRALRWGVVVSVTTVPREGWVGAENAAFSTV